jgi:hypothetical protein
MMLTGNAPIIVMKGRAMCGALDTMTHPTTVRRSIRFLMTQNIPSGRRTLSQKRCLNLCSLGYRA